MGENNNTTENGSNHCQLQITDKIIIMPTESESNITIVIDSESSENESCKEDSEIYDSDEEMIEENDRQKNEQIIRIQKLLLESDRHKSYFAPGEASDLNDRVLVSTLASELYALSQVKGNKPGLLLHHKYKMNSEQNIELLKGVDRERFYFLDRANKKLPVDSRLLFFTVLLKLNIQYDKDPKTTECSPNSNREDQSSSDDHEMTHAEFCAKSKKQDTKYNHEKCAKLSICEMYDESQSEYTLNPSDDFFTKLFSQIVYPKFGDEYFTDSHLKNFHLWGKPFLSNIPRRIQIETYDVQYFKHVLGFMTKSEYFEFLIEADIDYAIDYLFSYVDRSEKEKKNLTNDLQLIQNFEKLFTYFSTNLILNLHYKPCEFIQTLIRIDSLKLIQDYLRNGFQGCLDQEVYKLIVKVVLKYGWTSIESSLTKSQCFLLFSEQNVVNNCFLVQELLRYSEKNVALDCFKSIVLPVFKRQEVLDQLAHQDMTGLVLAFSKTVKMLEYHKEDASIKELLQTISDLLSVRAESLEKFVAKRPVFSWKMPNAKLKSHPEIQKFLHSDKATFCYSNGFSSISEARKFEDRFRTSVPNEYSVRVTCSGTGRRAVANIEKTREYYENLVGEYDLASEELRKIKKLI